MKTVLKIVLYILALMSIMAGAAKLLQMPQEVGFFAAAGLGILPLMLLGAVQMVGALLALFQRFRIVGLSLIIVGFLASVIVIAMTGDMVFAAISVLPVLFGTGLLALELNSRRVG